MSRRIDASRHVDAQLLKELARGERTSAEVLDRGLSHLASRCGECRRTLVDNPVEEILERLGPGLGASIGRAKERFVDLARERAEAPERVTELLATGSLPEAISVLAANPRFQTWGVAGDLHERAVRSLEDAPRRAYGLSLLGVAAAEGLSKKRYGGGVVATEQAVATATLAGARVEVYADPAGAEALLSRANDIARSASDRSLVRAELALARMRLDLANGRRDAAVAAYEQVEAQTSRGGLTGQRLRGHLLLGRAHRGSGDWPRALGTFRMLAHFAKGNPADGDLVRWGVLEAARTLGEMGSFDEVLTELDKAPAENQTGEEGRGRGVGTWLRGRALSRLGRTSEAEIALEAAWQQLSGGGAGLEAAEVVIDLVELYREEGREEAVSDLLERAAVLYRVERPDRRVVAVLYGLQGAAARGELGGDGIWAAREVLLEADPGTAARPEPIN